jgi:hypothetical protein
MSRLDGAIMLDPDATLSPGELQVDIGSVVAVSESPAMVAPPKSGNTSSTSTASTTAPTTLSVPTANGQSPSSAQDKAQPFDPIACTTGSAS